MNERKHDVYFSTEIDNFPPEYETLLTNCITRALELEGMEFDCELNVLLTDDEGIHEINQEQRGVDRPTDVLSFPMFELVPGVPVSEEENENWDLFDLDEHEDGRWTLPLGDMVISYERCCAQAEEFGHSVARELGYLCVHSVLHLLGYDHMDGDDGPMKRQMRSREKEIMAELNLFK
ncbi:MAG: rRNA maturation RNase YbeY, partial [Oscillospiraceae bacterium]|nr:rRNA maturation RNase YbeY [Oscillospiraceae bacterium]